MPKQNISKQTKNLHNVKVKLESAESQLKFSESLINKNVSSLWRQSVDKLETKRIVESLEASNAKEEVIELKNVLVAKFIIDESLSDAKPELLYVINEKWSNRAIIIIFKSNDKENTFIYWKTKELHNFLTFKLQNEEHLKIDENLRKFIVEFLIISLDNGHLGEIFFGITFSSLKQKIETR